MVNNAYISNRRGFKFMMYTPIEFMYTPIEFMYTPIEFMYTPIEFMYTPIEFMYTLIFLMSLGGKRTLLWNRNGEDIIIVIDQRIRMLL